MSPLVAGLTVVAFGTSSPELAVSIGAALGGSTDLAMGNVAGSNIFNVLLILGLSAVVVPLTVSRQLVRLDVPLMVAASAGVWLLALDGRISGVDGALLLLVLAAYVGTLIRLARRRGGSPAASDGRGPRSRPWPLLVGMIVAGLAALVLGSRWLVAGAAVLARLAGVSELVIGLTVVAAGTSLPEVATSLLAAFRGERDIAVGNVVGSNIFNLLGVLGAAAVVAPGGVGVGRAAAGFDLPVMVATAVACLPIFFTGHRIDRWEGALFLIYYVAYVGYLLLDARQHDLLPLFSAVMMAFVVPLTVVTLAVLAVRAARR